MSDKSKSRKLFGTDGVRGTANIYPITAEMALKIGKAAAIVLRNTVKKPKFLIGKDPRLSGYMIEYALTSGICSTGADVLLVGPMPTPAIAHLTRSFAADAGIMISASHNPATDNGIKLFDSEGFKLPDEVELEIESLVLEKDLSKHNVSPGSIGRAYRIDDAQGRYIEFAKSSISNFSLKGLKIALDCANGAAYKVAPLILSELGAELIVINNSPDGTNINKDSGALHPEVARTAVLGHSCDVGISLDGDADRVILVDDEGTILDGDNIISFSANYLKSKGKLNKNTVVVTDYSNLGLDVLMKKKGISVVRAENGDRYVIEEMRKNSYNLGGEQSGHIIFSDFNSTGDGTISALQVLRIMIESKKKLSTLAKELKKFPQVLFNIEVDKKKPLKNISGLDSLLKEIKIKFGSEGRVFLRYSGTQNLLRIMLEGKNLNEIESFGKKI
ncbi:MAG: phosphoglucosamine mutase [Nanoarchaeota archaeon]|nr:phosphoglucosamine mutase [Nanoarchaeota archaeon]